MAGKVSGKGRGRESASLRREVAQLARDIVIAAISTGSGIPQGQAIRQVVREARAFYSELDAPTVPPKKKERREDEDPEPGAEPLDLDTDELV